VKAGTCALALALAALSAASCAPPPADGEIRYLIGVSQANLIEPWRYAMCEDIRLEAASRPGLRVIFQDAADSPEKQAADVRRLMELGCDLLIVSEIDSPDVTGAVAEAYRSVPVILIDRAVEGFDYSLFIGPDNEQIGREAGRYAAELLGDRGGAVLEIQGRFGSPPSMDRSAGFRAALARYPGITILEPLVADWLRDSAEDTFYDKISAYPKIDMVFAQNDAMALGAARAAARAGKADIRFVGIDGLPGPDGGLDLVRRGVLAATFICPTGGREAVEYGIDILDRREGIPKKIFLRTRKVTPRDLLTGEIPEPYVAPKPTDGRRVVIGFAQVGHESQWRKANTESIKEAVGKAGYDLIFVDCENVPEKQVAAIEGFIERRVDVIALSPIVESGFEPVLRRAKEAGIPVFLIDRSVDTKDDSLWVTLVGSDFLEEGRRAGRWLGERLAGRPAAKVVEIRGTRGSAPALNRRQGFDESLLSSAGLKVARSVESDFTYEGGRDSMRRIIAEEGPFDALFAHNDDMALGAIEAMEEAGLAPGRDILVVSVDAVRDAFLAMMQGKLNCTVECTPLLGPQLVKAVQDYLAGKSMPIRIITDEGVFTSEDASRLLGSRKY
jgi:simple sugar transport system substrate-binding protein